MSTAYKAVGWNRQKRRYDIAIAAGVVAYLGVFISIGLITNPNTTIETLLIRAAGTAALLLLSIVLSIGPLCRLDRRFLPLLYNRRHLGVTTALLATCHGVFAVVQFHALGDVNPVVSVLVTSRDYSSLTDFPYQQLGLGALGILWLMAATSHDFWLRTLTAPVWKAIHMLVYPAYALIVAHVALGALQAEQHAAMSVVMFAGLGTTMTLHLLAARREWHGDRARRGDFVDVCAADEIPDGRARTVCIGGERVAVFRYDGRVSAVSNACRHQNGPLGDGKVVGGCIVCPWHGYEYDPCSGRAPAPFTERLPTFDVRVIDGRVLVSAVPSPPGTYIEPARIQ